MKIIKALLILALLIPNSAYAAIAVGWSATSTASIGIMPNKFNGIDMAFYVNSLATSTIGGKLVVGSTTDPGVNANLQIYNNNTAGAWPAVVIGGASGGDTDFWFARQNDNDAADDDFLQWGKTTVPGTNVFTTLTSAGLFGIGTTTPASRLEVLGTTTATGFVITSLSNTVLAVDGSGNVIATTTSGGSGSGTVNSGLQGQTAYYAANGTAVTGTSTIFLSNQTVGINQTSALATLHVTANAGQMPCLFTDSTGLSRLECEINGNIGVSSTTPAAKLSIHDSLGAATTTALFQIASSTTAAAATSTLFQVTGGGFVGIGTTATTGSTGLVVKSPAGAAFNTKFVAAAGTELVTISNTGRLCVLCTANVIGSAALQVGVANGAVASPAQIFPGEYKSSGTGWPVFLFNWSSSGIAGLGADVGTANNLLRIGVTGNTASTWSATGAQDNIGVVVGNSVWGNRAGVGTTSTMLGLAIKASSTVSALLPVFNISTSTVANNATSSLMNINGLGNVSLSTTSIDGILNLGLNPGGTASSTIKMHKIQFEGLDSAGTLYCMYFTAGALGSKTGACTP